MSSCLTTTIFIFPAILNRVNVFLVMVEAEDALGNPSVVICLIAQMVIFVPWHAITNINVICTQFNGRDDDATYT